jgi:hypothetical protein
MQGPLSRLGWAFVVLYMAVAAGYGGWRGPDVWSGWGIWCFLVPPVAWVAVVALVELRWNPGWTSVKIALALGGFGAVGLGAVALGTAWVMAEITMMLSSEPIIRAALGAGIWIGVGALSRLSAKPANAAGPVEPEAPSEGET